MTGGGVDPGIEGLPPDIDTAESAEASGLAVIWQMILESIRADLGGEFR